jgi:hypothetical protein
MNLIMRLMIVSMLMVVAAPAYSAVAAHVAKCEQDDDATEAQIQAGAAKWLKAAKGMKGGENLTAKIYYPVAAGDLGENDLLFVIIAPSFEEWGAFWDGYEGSAAAQVDQENREFVICPSSNLWEVVKVE